MAKIRTVEKEATLVAEAHGHALYLWRREFGSAYRRKMTETVCALCDERFVIGGERKKAPEVAGAAASPCNRKAVS